VKGRVALAALTVNARRMALGLPPSSFLRPENERQALIAELRRLRAAGLNVDRQDRVLFELRTEFVYGWPEPSPVLGY
jgi:hypothetical protein